MNKFEIVDGVVRGYATATVEISYEIPMYDLAGHGVLEGEADDEENFLDDMQETLENEASACIQRALDSISFNSGDDVSIDSCDTPMIHSIEVEAEVEEVEDDEDE
jgi:hypothetical protein